MKALQKKGRVLVSVILLCGGAVGAASKSGAQGLESLPPEDKQKIRRQVIPGMEVRQFLSEGLGEFAEGTDRSMAKALLRLHLLIGEFKKEEVSTGGEEVHATHQRRSAAATMEVCFFSQARFFDLYDRLHSAGLVDEATRSEARQVAERFLQPAERGPNNRPLHFALGQAYALKHFPDSPGVAPWRRYAEAVWDDFYGPGDNYEPGYVAHWFPQILELGLLLGKEEELRSEKMRQMYARQRDHVSPGGLVVAPGDGHGQDSYVEGLIRAAGVTGDETLLWAAEKTLLAGTFGYARDRRGKRVPEDEQRALLQEKLGHLYAAGRQAKVPATSSAVSLLYPATYRIQDRLILNPSRETGNPYAAFYLNDRQNTTFHGHEDNRGDLYHYEVDGTLYLSRSHWSKWPGQANTFVVSDATLEFPYNQTGGMVSRHWYLMSENMRILLDYQDSAAWQSETPGRRFQETSGSPGYNHTNPDGLAGKCDDLTIRTVSIQLLNFPREEVMSGEDHYLSHLSFDRGGVAWYRDYRKIAPSDGPYEVLLANLFIAGKKGERVIERFDRIPDNLKILHYAPGTKGQEPVELDKNEVLELVTDAETGKPVLKVTCPLGRIDLVLEVEDITVNLNTEYQRLGCRVQYLGDVSEFLRAPLKIAVNGFVPRSMYADHQQGGLLTDSGVEEKNGDCFGSMSYEGVWTHDSSWTRQALLSREGLLVVVDRFSPGPAADGMVGGPVWQLFSPPESGLHWFDAVQDFVNGNRLLVFFNYERGVQYGVQFQPKLWGVDDYAVYARKPLASGKDEVFVTTFVPHPGAVSGVQVSGLPHHMGHAAGGAADSGVRARVEPDGQVVVDWDPPQGLEMVIPSRMTLQIRPDGAWQIER
jgi:hypothetical protein